MDGDALAAGRAQLVGGVASGQGLALTSE